MPAFAGKRVTGPFYVLATDFQLAFPAKGYVIFAPVITLNLIHALCFLLGPLKVLLYNMPKHYYSIAIQGLD